MRKVKDNFAKMLAALSCLLLLSVLTNGQIGRIPDRETGWFNGSVVGFNAEDWLPQKAPSSAQGDIFVVVYPIGWQNLGLGTPQCAPCDHAGNGVGFDDFHDHVLDAIPGYPGFSSFKRVNVVLPNYTFLSGGNDPDRDAAISMAYAAHFPVTSVEAVDDLLNSTAPDGSPLAIRIYAGFYVHFSFTDKS
jgi:hypothetical protein